MAPRCLERRAIDTPAHITYTHLTRRTHPNPGGDIKLRDLTPGTTFRYEFGRSAVLGRHGDMGASIRYRDGAKESVIVSDDSDVEPLAEPPPAG
jgi:hypothetical protein